MAVQVLADLIAEITRNRDLDASAIAALNGFEARITAAVQAAIANGATAAELEPVTAAVADFKASNDALAEAIVANTPAA